MTHLRKSRFWLLSAAVLISGAPLMASAQNSTVYQPGSYYTGAPTMVAAAPSLPNISADQIASDVTAEFNPRSGQTELVAAPFDPFEDDPLLAGSLRLRSANGAVTLNGQPLQNGALVDVDFYYNSPSDDPYSGRNYSGAAFVAGDLAPVVLRDTRILECSTRVHDVVYEHNAYYGPSSSRYGIYQPYRHYAGHSSYGFGFGSNYFGPGYSFYNNNRSRRTRGRNAAFLPRVNTPNAGNRLNGQDARERRERLIGRVLGGNTASPRTQAVVPSATSSNLTATDIQQRIGGIRSNATALRNGGSLGPRRFITAQPRVVAGPAPTATQTATSAVSSGTESRSNAQQRRDRVSGFLSGRSTSSRAASSQDRGVVSGQGNPKLNARVPVAPRLNGTRVTPRQSVSSPVIPKRTSPKLSAPKTSSRKTSSSKKSSSTKSRSSSSKTKSRSAPKRSTSSSRSSKRSSSPSRRSSSSRSSQRKLNFWPNNGYGGRSYATSTSVDCAREDKLSVFIPNDRLDAARFDGLTLIALNARGEETPIYIPPNYIQGYRLAETGRVQPQGYTQGTPQTQYQQPQYQQPQPYQSPRSVIEAAPCPTATLKQADGTCLQTSGTGYPTR